MRRKKSTLAIFLHYLKENPKKAWALVPLYKAFRGAGSLIKKLVEWAIVSFVGGVLHAWFLA